MQMQHRRIPVTSEKQIRCNDHPITMPLRESEKTLPTHAAAYLRYPLLAPALTPSINCRWKIRYSTTVGMKLITVAAKTRL